ncbi:9328_t:CDS:10 [Diversispora eburnea]|uniref:General negative regulator of transcription subunit n=1 Tax=Diversispora eburnea TaxID=1213867 RepID=A0A9N8WPD4_9GLOM|nr:9328_t:CDS:10 [Diversispora eburnea]
MANRKLQTEIDRVLKKVAEGVETFEGIFIKIQATTNSNQKEKLEQDLKKEIKKLQRHRDQIKTWISSNDIKDKRALLDNRRLIEQQMEKFKACEKEMKTKAYSKEGLQQSIKMDPKEKEKIDTCDFVSNQIDALATQIETAEAEVEQLQGAVKKGRKDSSKADRLGEVEIMIERHKFHVNRLELILRLLENEEIKFYVECNQDPDFAEDENIYDELNLEEEEELWGITNDDHHSNDESNSDEPRSPSKEPSSPTTSPTTRVSAPTKAPAPVPSRKKIKLPPPPPILTGPSVISPPPSATFTPPPKSAPLTGQIRTVAAVAKQGIQDTPQATSTPQRFPIVNPAPTIQEHPIPTSAPQPPSALSSDIPNSSDPKQEGSSNNETSSTSSGENRIPAVLSDLVQSFEAAEEKFMGKEDSFHIQQMLDTSLQYIPDSIDSERPKYYVPKTPYQTPSYFPQTPTPMLDNPASFEKFDIDTLFFIFYYQQGTYQQYLAARELKKQSWRFHKKYLTWFQRHEEPKAITDEYEQGTYIYFDYEGAWCQRKKTEFRSVTQSSLEEYLQITRRQGRTLEDLKITIED